MEDDIAEAKNPVFLNLVVQKVEPSNIQTFMRSWMKQQCKDFRIVFLHDPKTASKEEKEAVAYAKRYTEVFNLQDNIQIVASYSKALPSQQTRFLKDTSILPTDKLEILKLKSSRQSQKTTKVLATANPLLKDFEVPVKVESAKPIMTQPKEDRMPEAKKVKAAKQKVFFRIIVPNHNNIAYVKKCLDSILTQSFQDFKVIIVDDLSGDRSDRICQAYQRNHEDKIVFLQVKQKGYAGGARNLGLAYPLDSEYTWFIDSDDWFYNDKVFECVHDAIVKKKFPKILRCPLFHFFGVGAKGNRVDQLPLGKMNILLTGCGPSRNCIKSEFVKTFVENRSKSNDVVWFLRTIDPLSSKDIAEVKFPCQVYNRISTTSCQNNIDVMISEKCIADQKLLAEDLKKEKFTSDECIKFQKDEIFKREHLFKPRIQLDQLLANSYVISIDKTKHSMFVKIFKNAKLLPTPTLHIGSTILEFTGPQNCAHSHIQIVKMAKKKGLPFVCVFEDDAFPCIDVAPKLSKYLNCIPYDANLVLLGWSNYNRRKRQRFNMPFNKIEQPDISGSHAYILFENGYDDYLAFFEDNPLGRADNNIFSSMSKSYILNYPLFIQYSETKSMNRHIGYIFYGDHQTPPEGFPTIKEIGG